MASNIEDAETDQYSTSIISPYEVNYGVNDSVPLTSPASASGSARRSSSTQLQKGTSIFGSTFLVINAALGAGLLNFPQAFSKAGGVEVALAVQAVLVVFVITSLLFLAKCSDASNACTVQEVLSHSCGKVGQHVGSFCVALYCFGTCITFLIIIGDQFDRALASWYGDSFCHYWYMQRSFTISACSVVFILPMCFSSRIDFLKYASSLGVIAIAYVVGIIVYEYFGGNYIPGPVSHQPEKWTDVFLVVPAICFGYQCHVSAVPIYSCMEQRSVRRFSITVCSAMLVCVLAYSCAGAFGYLTFGSRVPSDILEEYDARKPYILIAIVALAAKTCTTYPILAFCGREGLFNMLREFGSPLFWTDGKEKISRAVISIIWFASSLLLALLIPDIGQVIQILGCLAAVFIFVFPGISLLQLTLRQDPSFVRRKNTLYCVSGCVLIVIGIFLFGIVFTQALRTDTSHDNTNHTLCNVSKLQNILLLGA